MTAVDHELYYARRAEDQISLAQKSSDPRAVQAHYELATAYLERAYAGRSVRAASG